MSFDSKPVLFNYLRYNGSSLFVHIALHVAPLLPIVLASGIEPEGEPR